MNAIHESPFGFPSKQSPAVFGPVAQNKLGRLSSFELTNESVTTSLVIQKSSDSDTSPTIVGQLLFVRKNIAAATHKIKSQVHVVKSLQAMNTLLYQDSLREDDSKYQTSGKILSDWNFIGVVDNPDYASRVGNYTRMPLGVVNVIVGRGAMCFNYWAASFRSMLPQYADEPVVNCRKLTHLWLLLVKVNHEDLEDRGLETASTLGKRSFSVATGGGACWQFVPFATIKKCPPDYGTYMQEGEHGWTGDCIYVGRSTGIRGDFSMPRVFNRIVKSEILRKADIGTHELERSRIPLCDICL